MAGQSGAIKAGAAFVELFVDDNLLYRGLDRAKTFFLTWAKRLTAIGATLGAAGTGILAPLTKSLHDVVERGNSLQQLADNIGTTVTTVSALAYGFEQVGVSGDEFANSLTQIKKQATAASLSNDYYSHTLKSLGTGLQVAAMGQAEYFDRVAKTVRGLTDPITQLMVAEEAYPGIGSKVVKTLRDQTKTFADLQRAAEQGGGLITPEQGAQSKAITSAITLGWQDLKYTLHSVGLELVPTAAGIAEMGSSFKKGLAYVRDFIKENRATILTVAAVGVGLVTAGSLAVGLGATFAAVGAGIGVSLAIVKGAFALLLSPIGLVTAAVVGIGYVIATQTEAGQRFITGLRAEFKGLAATAVESFGLIAEAIGSGDWQSALDLGLATLRSMWADAMLYLTVQWNAFKDTFVDGWSAAVDETTDLIVGLVGLWTAAINGSMEAGRQAMKELYEQLIPMQKQEAEERRKARDADAKAAQDAANAARGALAEARREAQHKADERADAAARKGVPIAGAKPGIGAGGVGQIPGVGALTEAVKGIFQGPVGRQLNVGDNVPAQQLDALRGIQRNADQLPQMAKDLNVAAGALRFAK